VTIVTTKAIRKAPEIAIKQENSLPASVLAEMSPYPTVVSVIMTNQIGVNKLSKVSKSEEPTSKLL